MATLGYARVSSTGQSLDRQTDALAQIGCDRVFVEKQSGARVSNRPELVALLDYARAGDTVIVTELARLGRSLLDLIAIVSGLGERSIEFRSLKEQIDTTTPAGKLVFHLLAALAEFERDVIRQRAAEGRAAAKARGKTGGHPPVDPEKLDAARDLIAAGKSAKAAARAVGIGRSTLYRHGVGTAGQPAAVSSATAAD